MTALRHSDPETLSTYAEHFVAVINEFLSVRNERKATAEVFDLPSDCPLQVVKFTMTPRSSRLPNVRVVARQELGPLLDRIATGLPVEIATDVYMRRHVRILWFGGSVSDQTGAGTAFGRARPA